jgi:hypothetical protein
MSPRIPSVSDSPAHPPSSSHARLAHTPIISAPSFTVSPTAISCAETFPLPGHPFKERQLTPPPPSRSLALPYMTHLTFHYFNKPLALTELHRTRCFS